MQPLSLITICFKNISNIDHILQDLQPRYLLFKKYYSKSILAIFCRCGDCVKLNYSLCDLCKGKKYYEFGTHIKEICEHCVESNKINFSESLIFENDSEWTFSINKNIHYNPKHIVNFSPFILDKGIPFRIISTKKQYIEEKYQYYFKDIKNGATYKLNSRVLINDHDKYFNLVFVVKKI